MTAPNESKREQLGYFHALSKIATEGTQEVFESLYKSSHNIRSSDVWAEAIAYALDASVADNEVSLNSAVSKYTQTPLTEIPGSNGQAWYLSDGGEFVRPWISPVDVPHETTAAPSSGYQALLYKSNNTLITPTEGSWLIDYYAGVVLFQSGYTPSNMGWGVPRITNYIYTGQTVDELISSLTGGNSIDNEDLTDQIDGISTEFTLSQTPIAGSLKLYFNGMRQRIDYDHTISGNTITFTETPTTDDHIVADFKYA